MNLFDLTLPTPAENLACDEALLDACEEGAGDEVLRFWEAGEYFVVVGYSNKISTEVNMAECERRGFPVLRRCSGGGTVVQGPGCLNYALVLKIPVSGPLASLTQTNQFIMQRHATTMSDLLGNPVHVQGHTDLVLGQRKFSGNSQRRKRRYLLFHGSFLLNFDLALIESLLPIPSRKPAYRGERSHGEFLANLPVSSSQVKAALTKTWDARGAAPAPVIPPLLTSKYTTKAWNFRC